MKLKMQRFLLLTHEARPHLLENDRVNEETKGIISRRTVKPKVHQLTLNAAIGGGSSAPNVRES